MYLVSRAAQNLSPHLPLLVVVSVYNTERIFVGRSYKQQQQQESLHSISSRESRTGVTTIVIYSNTISRAWWKNVVDCTSVAFCIS